MRLEVQLIQAQERKTVFLIMPKGKVTSGFVKICLKAALVPDKPFLRKKLCESFDHQILRLVNILYVSVYVKRQRIAVALGQQVGGLFLSA